MNASIYDNTLLFDLAAEYHRRCEAYDRTVCTGPVTRDGVLPADARQLYLINRHASTILHEIKSRATICGFTNKELMHAISKEHP